MARKKSGLSVREAAADLNLSPDVITAIEEDAYHRLPDSTFTRGYLRAYAKLLKLDQEEIVARAPLDPDKVPGNPYELETVARSPYRPRPGPGKRGGGFLLVVLIIAALAVAVYRVPGFSVNQLLEVSELPARFSEMRKSFGEISLF